MRKGKDNLGVGQSKLMYKARGGGGGTPKYKGQGCSSGNFK